MRNFDYIKELGLTDLYRYCSAAEENQVSNPDICAINARRALEYIVRALYQMKNIEGQIDKVGTHQQIYDFEIGVIPGICAFVTDNVALEVAVGLIGLNYQKVNQYSNQTEYSSMVSSGANYKINLLNLSFGISFYIPTGQHSMKKLKEYKSKNS